VGSSFPRGDSDSSAEVRGRPSFVEQRVDGAHSPLTEWSKRWGGNRLGKIKPAGVLDRSSCGSYGALS